MTLSERAVQIWPILVLSASRRQTLTYDELSRLIGVSVQAVPEFLEPIQAYCLLEGLAPLTAIVVNQISGLPGGLRAPEVPRAQANVFARDWLRDSPPRVQTFDYVSEGMLVRRARARQRRAEERAKKQRPRRKGVETKAPGSTGDSRQ